MDFTVTCDKVPILCDNESVIKIAYNPIQHIKKKHIEIHHHFLRDHVKRGDIELSYVGTGYQLADIFTNPLDEVRFRELRHELNIIDSSNVVCKFCIPTLSQHSTKLGCRHGYRGSVV